MLHGRTPLFRKLMQTVQQARWLNENPQHRTLFFEAQEASRVSRRDFVRMLGATGMITLAGGFAPRPARGSPSPTPDTGSGDPVAIIGAGVAGLTAAYRLLQAGVPCEIFEGSERTGGRILTKYDFNKDGMFCELGGELVDTNHEDLIALARRTLNPLSHYSTQQRYRALAKLSRFSAGNTARGSGKAEGWRIVPSPSAFADDQARAAGSSLSESGDTYPTCGFRLSARGAGDARRQVDRQGGS
jgi:hypothetical protein